jgi:hypothetical protein
MTYISTAALFEDVMNETVTINVSTAKDKYGKNTFSASGTAYTNCRIQTDTARVQDAAGNQIVTRGKVYVLGAVTISIGDKITLPDGDNTPIIVKIDDVDDDSTIHHTVLHFA